jgi:hypothetical protein
MLTNVVVVKYGDQMPYYKLETLKKLITRVALRKLGVMKGSEKRLEEAA